MLHSAQKTLEKSAHSDSGIHALLEKFVSRASPGTKKDPGSFAKAICHSVKMGAAFSAKVKTQLNGVAEVLNQDFSCHHASQRFDSIANAVKKVIISLEAVLGFLLDIAAQPKHQKCAWAQGLLDAALID